MRLNTFYQPDYSGGLNNTASSSEIKRNEASLLRNWDITYQGQLVKRSGLTLTGNDFGNNAVLGLGAYLRSTGSKDLVLMEGTTLRYLNSTTFDSLDTGFTTGLDTCFVTCPINNKLYIYNGTENTHSWDRASVTNNSCLTDMGSTIPTGKIGIWHKNHMFVINNVKWGGTNYYNRIAWSAIGDPDTWDTANDYIDLPGGDKGVTFGYLGDSLVIYKEHSIMFLSGWGDTDWKITASSSNVNNIDESVGIAGPYARTRVGNEEWFMDDEGQIRRLYQTDFDAFRKDIISTKIQSTLSGLNRGQLSKVKMWTALDKVFVSVPNGASTTNNLILVFDLVASRRTGEEAWTTYTGINANAFVSYPTSSTIIDLYIGDATDGKVYKFTGSSDNGVAIDSRWDGKDDDYDRPELHKRFKFGYITGEATDDVDVQIYASVDGGSFANVGTLNLNSLGTPLGPTGTARMGPTGTFILGGNSIAEEKVYFTNGGGSTGGKSLMMSIRHAVDAETASVNTFSVHYKPRNLR